MRISWLLRCVYNRFQLVICRFLKLKVVYLKACANARNIVEPNILRSLEQPSCWTLLWIVISCWILLRKVWNAPIFWTNNSQHFFCFVIIENVAQHCKCLSQQCLDRLNTVTNTAQNCQQRWAQRSYQLLQAFQQAFGYCSHRDTYWLPSNDPRTKVHVEANGGLNISVCVQRWHLVLVFTVASKFCSRNVVVLSSLASVSPWDRVKSIAPLSFAHAAMEGFPVTPVQNCVLSKFLPTIPRISPCRSLRGRSKARQQEKDHCGFLRHSLKYWYKYTRYWTEREMNNKNIIKISQIFNETLVFGGFKFQ